MKPSDSPFKPLWMGIELPGRRINATYGGCNYDELPVLAIELRGDLHWLPEVNEEKKARLRVYQRPEVLATQASILEGVLEDAVRLRLQLPPEFVRFMSSPELQEEIPSATACYFKLGKQFIRCPFGDGGYLLSFYHDQQDCLIWYIYVQNSGEHAVVVSPYNLNELEGQEAVPVDQVRNAIFFCGESFEAYLHREWVENAVWFASEHTEEDQDDCPLPLSVRDAYLAHYKQLATSTAEGSDGGVQSSSQLER